MNQTRETMRLLLTKIAEDPLSSSCPNISYVDVTGPVASAYPTGSPYALFSPPPTGPPHHPHPSTAAALSPCSPPGRCFMHPLQQQQQQHHHHGGGGGGGGGGPLSSPTSAVNGRLESLAATVGRRMTNGRSAAPQSLLGAASLPAHGGGGGTNLWSSSTSPPFPISLDAVRGFLHSTGYTEDAMDEITHAMRVLNAYGLLSLTNLASYVGYGSGGGNGSRPSMSQQLTTIPPPIQTVQEVATAPAGTAASSSPFGSPAFPSASPQQQAQQQQQGQAQQPPSVDTLYRPQDSGGGLSAAVTNAEASSR